MIMLQQKLELPFHRYLELSAVLISEGERATDLTRLDIQKEVPRQ